MLALLALIAFVVGLVKLGSFDTWQAWLLLGLIFLAADALYHWAPWDGARRRRVP